MARPGAMMPARCCWPRPTAARRTRFWSAVWAGAVAGLYELGNRPAARLLVALLLAAYLMRWITDMRADQEAERRAQFWERLDRARSRE